MCLSPASPSRTFLSLDTILAQPAVSFDPVQRSRFRPAMLCHEPGIGPQESTYNEKHFPCRRNLALAPAPSGRNPGVRPVSDPQRNTHEINTIRVTWALKDTSRLGPPQFCALPNKRHYCCLPITGRLTLFRRLRP